MKNVCLLLVLGLSSATPALAQSPCGSLALSWDQNMKEMALSKADSFGERSVPRAALRQAEIGNQLLKQQMNLTLMIQHKCPLPVDAIDDGSAYLTDALQCSTAMIKGERDSPSYKFENWKSTKDRLRVPKEPGK